MEKNEKQEEIKKASPLKKGDAKPQKNILLGTVSYNSEEDYEAFLKKMHINQAIFILLASANYAQAKGAFNLDESELINKAIKTIKKLSTEAPKESKESEK